MAIYAGFSQLACFSKLITAGPRAVGPKPAMAIIIVPLNLLAGPTAHGHTVHVGRAYGPWPVALVLGLGARRMSFL